MSTVETDRPASLPRRLPLIRHQPARRPFDWAGFRPEAVRAAADLPPYLVMGPLDEGSFRSDAERWCGRWLGPEPSTRYELSFDRTRSRYAVSLAWRGIEGTATEWPVDRGFVDAALRGLVFGAVPAWDEEAKRQLEADWQIEYLPQPKEIHPFIGLPDGLFRTILLFVPAREIRSVRDRLGAWLSSATPPYPVSVDLRLLRQVVNYVEGKAPAWTAHPSECFRRNVEGTGLFAAALPEREVRADGVAAWTIRRSCYALSIQLPFPAVVPVVERLAVDLGLVRPKLGDPVGAEMLPVVIPALYDTHASGLGVWDAGQTTRSTIAFEREAAAASEVPDPRAISEALWRIEEASGAMVAELDRFGG